MKTKKNNNNIVTMNLFNSSGVDSAFYGAIIMEMNVETQ